MQDLIHTVISARLDVDANKIKCNFSGIPHIIARIATFYSLTPFLVLFTALSMSGNTALSVGMSDELTALTKRRSCDRGTLPEFAW